MGIRYKCSVCKNFDYCEICEERHAHDHPFIKITKPEHAPVAIITGLNEEEKQPQPIAEESEKPQGYGRREGGRGGHRGCGRGRAFRHIANQMIDIVTRGMMGTARPEGNHEEESKGATEEDDERADDSCEKRSKWSEQRAVILSKPKGPIVT